VYIHWQTPSYDTPLTEKPQPLPVVEELVDVLEVLLLVLEVVEVEVTIHSSMQQISYLPASWEQSDGGQCASLLHPTVWVPSLPK